MKMISEEQKELADYVKQVHLSLRRKTREIGAEKAWEQHLKNDEVLAKYAFSMKALAEKFWSSKNETPKGALLCRIQWIVDCVVNYFQKGFIKNEIEKEFKKMEKFAKKGLLEENIPGGGEESVVPPSCLKLLDVGSCYNPFQKFDFLEVYPIDLHPATAQVKKCNFIESRVVNLTGEWFHDGLIQFPASFFDVVVFSLFLEYLPSPRQRYVSCANAYDCLKTNGLLLIVTPDSKHATANAALMKNWKIAAAKIGFVRTRLEKLKYLYCMAFRKSVYRKYPLLLYSIDSADINPEEMFVIPQDSVDYKLEEKSAEKKHSEEPDMRELFEELPFGESKMATPLEWLASKESKVKAVGITALGRKMWQMISNCIYDINKE